MRVLRTQNLFNPIRRGGKRMFSYTLGAGTPVHCQLHCQLHCQFHFQPHAHQRITHAHSCAPRTLASKHSEGIETGRALLPCAPRTIASKPIVSQTRTCLHAAVIEQKTAEFCLAHRFLMGKVSFFVG